MSFHHMLLSLAMTGAFIAADEVTAQDIAATSGGAGLGQRAIQSCKLLRERQRCAAEPEGSRQVVPPRRGAGICRRATQFRGDLLRWPRCAAGLQGSREVVPSRRGPR